MKNLKNNWYYILMFVVFALFSLYFPLSGKDLFWANITDFKSISDFFDISNGNFITSLILFAATKSKIIKAVTYGVISTSLFVLLKNIVNKKNSTLVFISLFLFLLIDNIILGASWINTTGFITNFLSVVFILIYLYFILGNKLINLDKSWIFLLGVISSSINIYTTLILLIASCIDLIYCRFKKKPCAPQKSYLLGLLVGTFVLSYGLSRNEVIIFTKNINSNLLHNIIPMIFNINFFFFILVIAALMIVSIKIYLRGDTKNKIKILLSMAGLTTFALVYLFSQNDILRYIAFIIYNFSSIYILISMTNSTIFKNRISMYYLIKCIYIFILMFSPDLNSGDMLFIILMEIILLLEVVNYIFPINFMKNSWTVLSFSLCSVLLYMFINMNERFNDMNLYIKHNVECGKYIFTIPSKYENKYIYKQLPETYGEEDEYIKYYNINTDSYFVISFNETKK